MSGDQGGDQGGEASSETSNNGRAVIRAVKHAGIKVTRIRAVMHGDTGGDWCGDWCSDMGDWISSDDGQKTGSSVWI